MTNDEVNRKIAEQVMGWHLDDEGFWRNAAGRPQMSSGDVENYPPLRYTDWPTWNPCGNWAHFGLVLGRVCAENHAVDIAISEHQGVWSAWLVGADEHTAGTPLEAACRAILEAWGDA